MLALGIPLYGPQHSPKSAYGSENRPEPDISVEQPKHRPEYGTGFGIVAK